MLVTSEKIVIPQISDLELLKLVEKIKPMMEVADLGLHYISIKDWTPEQLRMTSFLWDRKSGGKVRRPLKRRQAITTFHTFGAPALFKPSIAEVLAQISPEQRAWCRGFILEDDLTASNIHPEGFHFTTTHLYGL